MNKYAGIAIVLIAGFIAIGLASYQAVLLQQTLAENGTASSSIAFSRHWFDSVLSKTSPAALPGKHSSRATSSASSTAATPSSSQPVASSSPTQASSTSQTAGSTEPVAKLAWGVFAGDQNDNLSAFESLVGKKADIQAVFLSWHDDFPTYFKDLCPNKTLLIFWENTGFSLDNIIAGKYDSYLRNFSSGAQQYGCPVMISLFHEMNGDWDTWDGPVGTNSAAKIISAWRHVHDLVTASNVKWAWAINNVSVPDTAANKPGNYYPGDAYVDYVGVDGFNSTDEWNSFADTFDPSIALLEAYHKPIYIFSMGAMASSKKAAWIADGLGSHVKTYKNFAGWVWFNQNGVDGNWSVDSDPASLAAFIAAIP